MEVVEQLDQIRREVQKWHLFLPHWPRWEFIPVTHTPVKKITLNQVGQEIRVNEYDPKGDTVTEEKIKILKMRLMAIHSCLKIQ